MGQVWTAYDRTPRPPRRREAAPARTAVDRAHRQRRRRRAARRRFVPASAGSAGAGPTTPAWSPSTTRAATARTSTSSCSTWRAPTSPTTSPSGPVPLALGGRGRRPALRRPERGARGADRAPRPQAAERDGPARTAPSPCSTWVSPPSSTRTPPAHAHRFTDRLPGLHGPRAGDGRRGRPVHRSVRPGGGRHELLGGRAVRRVHRARRAAPPPLRAAGPGPAGPPRGPRRPGSARAAAARRGPETARLRAGGVRGAGPAAARARDATAPLDPTCPFLRPHAPWPDRATSPASAPVPAAVSVPSQAQATTTPWPAVLPSSPRPRRSRRPPTSPRRPPGRTSPRPWTRSRSCSARAGITQAVDILGAILPAAAAEHGERSPVVRILRKQYAATLMDDGQFRRALPELRRLAGGPHRRDRTGRHPGPPVPLRRRQCLEQLGEATAALGEYRAVLRTTRTPTGRSPPTPAGRSTSGTASGSSCSRSGTTRRAAPSSRPCCTTRSARTARTTRSPWTCAAASATSRTSGAADSRGTAAPRPQLLPNRWSNQWHRSHPLPTIDHRKACAPMHKLSTGGSFAPPSSHRARRLRRNPAGGPTPGRRRNAGHPGAAAVVGGERIEVSAVQAQAADVRAAQESSPRPPSRAATSRPATRAKLQGCC
ncbi:hypothetical protein SCYAM73S_05433 [Streptomyces cyaneofuscatus]